MILENVMELPGYRLVQLAAQTSHILLYRGERTRDGAAVLVKLLRPECREARHLHRLSHEHLLIGKLDPAVTLQPLDWIEKAGRPALVLEHCAAVPLRQLIPAGGLALDDFLRLAPAICHALGRLHAQGCIHRDLQPEHILVDAGRNTVKFTGFGLAMLGQALPANASPEIDGTLPYLSPEQTGRTAEAVDTRSDLYSLGLILYEMLAGELPFCGRDALEWLHLHLAAAPRPLASLRSELPPVLAELVHKLLAKSPAARYQSAVGVELDLLQCARQWNADRSLASFPLGRHDVPLRLGVPDRLYGREAQVAQLLRGFDRVASGGQAELTLVRGEPGIGKSALVFELQSRLGQRILFASGKFDQYKRGIPYFTLAQAFRQLVQQMLGSSAASLAAWQARLRAALGANAKLVSDVIPELRLVLDELPEVPALGPVESRNRFALVFQDFIEAVATPGRPLLLFLDDMQWADMATLELMERLLTGSRLRQVHLLFAYRDTEVDAHHPLARLLERVRASGIRTSAVELSALTQAQVAELVADTLGCPAGSLAELLHRKTEGNPFFVRELLRSLYQEQLLRLDPRTRQWHWDAGAIDSAAVTDDIVELMVLRLRRLSQPAQALLQIAAAIGNSFEVSTLAAVAALPPGEVLPLLREAMDEGLLRAGGEEIWHFRHDRIQQAAYSTVEPGERPRLHRRIGRALLEHAEGDKLEQRLFDIVNQLNLGLESTGDAGDREQLVQLNLLAGRKAMAASAFGPALRYLTQATALMSADAWQKDYDRVLQTLLDRAECEYLAGEFDRAEASLQLALDHARCDIDRARVYGGWLLLHQISGRFQEGVELGAKALELFGVALPREPAALAARIRTTRQDIQQQLSEDAIGDLIDLPRMDDSRAKALAGVLAGMGPLTYLGRPEAFPLIPLELVKLSLQRGNTEESCFGYSMYAMLLVSVFDEVESGYRFSELAMALCERLKASRLRGVVLHIHGNHVSCWRQPFTDSLRYVEHAFSASLEAGDFIYSNYCAFMTGWLQLDRGAPLGELQESSERYLAFARQSRNTAVYETIRVEQQVAAALQGRTTSRDSLSDDSYDEQESVARIEEGGLVIGLGFYHTAKLMLHVVHGQVEAALQAAKDARARMPLATALPVDVSLDFFEGLAASAACCGEDCEERRSRLLHTVEECSTRVARRARDCPQNFQARSLLLQAEHLQLQGDKTAALQLYEQAVQAAQQAGALHDEALAHERAALFCERERLAGFAGFSRREARRAFLQWGAHAKVGQLDAQHPKLAPQLPAASAFEGGLLGEGLNLVAAIKASQAISSEIVLPKLSHTLMRLVLEHAGAERAALVLLEGDEFSLAAAVSAAGTGHEPPAKDGSVPESVLNYVRHSGETVLLEDARVANPYSHDPYLLDRRPRSLLCLPVKRQSRLWGMLYMENGQVTGAFTPARLGVLQLLAAQAAISLENAELYREAGLLASARQHADQLRELTRISVSLNASQTIEAMLETLAVKARELIGAHQGVVSLGEREDSKQALAAVSLSDKYAAWRSHDTPPDRSATYASMSPSNRPLRLTQAELQAHPAWGGHGIESKRHPPMRGWLAVPLLARSGRNIGLIQLSDKFTGEFTEEDEALLLQIAQLAAAVFERAGAQERLQEADRRKNEFIAMLSHELRNPLAPLRNAIELLQRSPAGAETARPLLGMMQRQVSHMVHLIDDLLDVSRITRGRIELRREPLTLSAILDSAIEASRPLIDEGRHELVLRVPVEPLHLHADRTRLAQVLSNLLNNAAKYTPRGGRIELSVARDGREAVIRVADNGVGLEPEMLQQVFEMFTQVGKTLDRSQHGLGIGLAIVKVLVEMHGGTVQAESAGLESGTVFTVRLPLAEQPAQLGELEPEAAAARHTPARRVLVVDDNVDAADTLVTMLELLGHEGCKAHSGPEALDRARRFGPSIVFCDIGMPGMDGYEVARHLRSMPGLSSALLVALTGWGSESDKQRAKEAGFDFHLTKPIDIAAVQELLAHGGLPLPGEKVRAGVLS